MFITTANTLDTVPGPAARPHGGHPARGLHGGGEAPDRQALPRAAPDRPQRAQEVADRLQRHRAEGDHQRLHARGGRPQPRARDRLGVPQGRAPGGGGQAREEAVGDRAEGARAARPPALPARRQAAHERAGRRHRAGVDAGRRRRAVRGGDRDAGQPRAPAAADRDRPARRRDARVGPGRALVRARARAPLRARPRRRLLRSPTTSTCTCRRARSRRTGRARASRWRPR